MILTFLISGQSITAKKLSPYDSAKNERTDKQIFDQFASTFLFDISSHTSDLSRYLNVILSTKKRRSDKNDDNQSEKSIKLSRRAKKKIQVKKVVADLKRQKKDCTAKTKVKDTDFNIERPTMFYADTILNTKTNRPLMALPNAR
jgi:hypothetical protein